VRPFLAAAARLFELHVYTMGARRYAAEMVKLLDPDGSLGLNGTDRVIAKEDSTMRHMKNLDVVIGSEDTTLIIDDTVAVWPHHAGRVLVPRRYHFFDLLKSPAAPSGPLLGAAEDEWIDSGQLESILTALRRIHAHFFDRLDRREAGPQRGPGGALDVRDSYNAVRRQVLHGKRLLFSHVIPLNEQSHPERHFAWRLAQELGATLTTSTTDSVTHVVAGRAGTDKVKWAASHPHVHAVSLDWLVTCGYLWTHVDESCYQVGPVAAAKPPS